MIVEAPGMTVVVLNYNGARWLERCLASLKTQTIFDRLEIIVADNASPDRSDELAARLMQGWPNGRVLQNGANLGFCEGNNRAARHARGRWLLFLNNDTWLEPECLEILLRETEAARADASCPLILDYDSDSFQSLGAAGFDVFGLASTRRSHPDRREVFMPEGCAYLIRREVFEQLGGFDPEFFMFADEFDLSWRLWRAGYRAVAVPASRLHHRGAAQVNPAGGGAVVEFRTSNTKRFYANRNGLMAAWKNTGVPLRLVLALQLLLLAAEALAGLVLIRRWSFVREAYLKAGEDTWRLRSHLRKERARLKPLLKRSDWAMLRFLKLRPNRWDELLRARRMGLPRVSDS
jgi:N-acetylglucosaminyl-diphospho-decaprenol L-rhamnosyltransferase